MSEDSKPSKATTHNLSYERRVAYLLNEKHVACSRIPEYEPVVVTVKKTDKKGALVLDADGFPELVEKRVLARDVEAKRWDDRLAEYRASHPNCKA